jgi:hypothetical protein
MDDNGMAVAMGILALCLAVMVSKRLDRLSRDFDLLIDGDVETVKLRRKLEGREDG